MKAVSKYVVLLSLGVLGSVAASATTIEQTYLDTCRKEPGVPVPISVVTPTIDAGYTGTTVNVEFIVDQTGKPANLNVKSPVDATLATAVMDAVKQWKFKPAERNGTPVATKVVLPVKVVDPLTSSIFAAN
jgi:protein TonB